MWSTTRFQKALIFLCFAIIATLLPSAALGSTVEPNAVSAPAAKRLSTRDFVCTGIDGDKRKTPPKIHNIGSQISLGDPQVVHQWSPDANYWQFGMSVPVTFSAEIKVDGPIKCTLTKTAAKRLTKKMTLPNGVTAEFAPVVELTAGGNLEAKLNVPATLAMEAEMHGTDFTWKTLPNISFGTPSIPLTPKAGVSAKLGGKLTFGFSKMGVSSGVYAQLSAELELAKKSGDCFGLRAKVPFEAGLSLKAWNAGWDNKLYTKDLYNKELSKLCVGAPSILTTLPAATSGISYDAYLRTKDNRNGSWSAPSLPAGLVFDPNSGRLYGVPQNPGMYTLQVAFVDETGTRSTASVPLTVNQADPSVETLKGSIARLATGQAWYIDQRGDKHNIKTGEVYNCLTTQGKAVKEVTQSVLDRLKTYEDAACVSAASGDILRTSDGDAYLMGTDGARRWISTGRMFECYTANGHVVKQAPRYFIMDLPQGANADFQCVNTAAVAGTVVKTHDGSSWYVDKRNGIHWIPDGGVHECLVAQGKSKYPHIIPRSALADIGVMYESAACVRAVPGDIVRHSDGDAYVVNTDWTRSWIPDGATYECLAASGAQVVNNVPRYWIDDLTQSANATGGCYDSQGVNGKVVRASDGSSWYIDKRGGKHWIPDGGTFECLAAQTGGAWPKTVPAAWLTQTQYEDAQCVRVNPGDLVRHSDGDVYRINGDWTRSWVPSAPVYVCLKAENRGFVDGVPRYWLMDLAQVGDAGIATGNCIVRKPNGAAFFINNQGVREWIPDSPTWDCVTGRGVPVINTTDGKVDAISEGDWHQCLNQGSLHGKMLRHSDGDVHYIHPDNTRTWIPDQFTYNCRANKGTPKVETLHRAYVNSFRDTGWDWCFDVNTFKNTFIRHPDGDAYWVDSRGVKHWVKDGGTYNCLKARYGEAITVQWRGYVDNLAGGDWAVCGDTLYRNQNFDRGQMLTSSNGVYQLHMQTDGNLVLYQSGRGAVWNSKTAGGSAKHLRLHDDGCLALVDSAGNWTWRPPDDPCGRGGDRLVVQSDGNLVIYAGSKAVWDRW